MNIRFVKASQEISNRINTALSAAIRCLQKPDSC